MIRRLLPISTFFAVAPRQLVAPAKGSAMDRLMKDFSGLTAQLTFLEDGLHAVVTVERK